MAQTRTVFEVPSVAEEPQKPRDAEVQPSEGPQLPTLVAAQELPAEGVVICIARSGSNLGETDDRLGIMWILYIIGVVLGCTPLIFCAPCLCFLSASCFFCKNKWPRSQKDEPSEPTSAQGDKKDSVVYGKIEQGVVAERAADEEEAPSCDAAPARGSMATQVGSASRMSQPKPKLQIARSSSLRISHEARTSQILAQSRLNDEKSCGWFALVTGLLSGCVIWFGTAAALAAFVVMGPDESTVFTLLNMTENDTLTVR